MDNVVIYARYSSDKQTEQSIEGQLRYCYQYAEQHDYRVVGEYIDRAISGTSDRRPQFQQMIADAEKSSLNMCWSGSSTASREIVTTLRFIKLN